MLPCDSHQAVQQDFPEGDRQMRISWLHRHLGMSACVQTCLRLSAKMLKALAASGADVKYSLNMSTDTNCFQTSGSQ